MVADFPLRWLLFLGLGLALFGARAPDAPPVNKIPAEAQDLMLQVHHRGMCVAGVYTYEIAETKVNTVEQMARAAEFPFLSTMEPE